MRQVSRRGRSLRVIDRAGFFFGPDELDNRTRTARHAMKMETIKREATAEIEPESGAVVQAFTTGTVVQVFLLAGQASTETWSGRIPRLEFEAK